MNEPLYSRAFVSLCVALVLGFACFGLLTPVIPILVIREGGDAALVGVVVAAYSIPSIVLRPYMGRLVDQWSRWRVFLSGGVVLGLSSFLYLLPSLGMMIVVRLLNGASFAAFNTGANTTLAVLAPPTRRGEASGIYNLMPSIAFMVAPAAGLILVDTAGPEAAVIVAGLLGIGSAFVVATGPLRDRRGERERIERRSATPLPTALIERRALMPMSIEAAWIAAYTLFVIYPPVWAAWHDVPVLDLAVYYPVVGLVLVVSRITVGRRVDRVPRGLAITIGVVGGSAALLFAATAESVAVLTLAGSFHAASSSAISPSITAIALERAAAGRHGATMATYSMGFPLGNGLGALAWGIVIATFGFPIPFVLAALITASILVPIWLGRVELFGGSALAVGGPGAAQVDVATHGSGDRPDGSPPHPG
jgi:MFS family permease